MGVIRRRTGDTARTGTTAPRTTLRIAVGRMTLEGRSRAEHGRVSAAMAATLARLIDGTPEFDWTAAGGAARLDAGAVPAGATPEHIGRQLARRLFRRLMTAAAPGDRDA
jgi:hypothetical protein